MSAKISAFTYFERLVAWVGAIVHFGIATVDFWRDFDFFDNVVNIKQENQFLFCESEFKELIGA